MKRLLVFFMVMVNLSIFFVSPLESGERLRRGWIGVVLDEVPPEVAKSFGLKHGEGALVTDVAKGGPADRAGIKQGDVIIQFNEKKIRNVDELPPLVRATQAGTEVEVKLLREGKEITIRLRVGRAFYV